MQEIAGIVGHPVCLHPTTENLTNIEVAKVYTIIDPRKKIPEFVNARFESGETKRIAVSTPWMPSLCSYCNRVGHTITHCKSAPRTCTSCNSVRHTTEQCPRGKAGISGDRVAIAGGRAVATRSSAEIARGRAEVARGKQHVKSLLPTVTKTKAVYVPVNSTETPPQDRRHPISPSGRKLSSLSIMEDTVDNLALTFGSPPAKTALETGSSSAACTGSKTFSIDFGMSGGSLSVDLTPQKQLEDSTSTASSGNSSASDIDSSTSPSHSEEEDNPDEGGDKFIDVISKRQLKQIKARGQRP